MALAQVETGDKKMGKVEVACWWGLLLGKRWEKRSTGVRTRKDGEGRRYIGEAHEGQGASNFC